MHLTRKDENETENNHINDQSYTEPENWKKINNKTVSVTKNYSYDDVEYQAVSLIVNPKIEFPITRYFGFTVSPMLQKSKDRTYFGIGLGSMIGILR